MDLKLSLFIIIGVVYYTEGTFFHLRRQFPNTRYHIGYYHGRRVIWCKYPNGKARILRPRPVYRPIRYPVMKHRFLAQRPINRPNMRIIPMNTANLVNLQNNWRLRNPIGVSNVRRRPQTLLPAFVRRSEGIDLSPSVTNGITADKTDSGMWDVLGIDKRTAISDINNLNKDGQKVVIKPTDPIFILFPRLHLDKTDSGTQLPTASPDITNNPIIPGLQDTTGDTTSVIDPLPVVPIFPIDVGNQDVNPSSVNVAVVDSNQGPGIVVPGNGISLPNPKFVNTDPVNPNLVIPGTAPDLTNVDPVIPGIDLVPPPIDLPLPPPVDQVSGSVISTPIDPFVDTINILPGGSVVSGPDTAPSVDPLLGIDNKISTTLTGPDMLPVPIDVVPSVDNTVVTVDQIVGANTQPIASVDLQTAAGKTTSGNKPSTVSCQITGCDQGSACVLPSDGSICLPDMPEMPCECRLGCKLGFNFIPLGGSLTVDECGNVCGCNNMFGQTECTQYMCNPDAIGVKPEAGIKDPFTQSNLVFPQNVPDSTATNNIGNALTTNNVMFPENNPVDLSTFSQDLPGLSFPQGRLTAAVPETREFVEPTPEVTKLDRNIMSAKDAILQSNGLVRNAKVFAENGAQTITVSTTGKPNTSQTTSVVASTKPNDIQTSTKSESSVQTSTVVTSTKLNDSLQKLTNSDSSVQKSTKVDSNVQTSTVVTSTKSNDSVQKSTKLNNHLQISTESSNNIQTSTNSEKGIQTSAKSSNNVQSSTTSGITVQTSINPNVNVQIATVGVLADDTASGSTSQAVTTTSSGSTPQAATTELKAATVDATTNQNDKQTTMKTSSGSTTSKTTSVSFVSDTNSSQQASTTSQDTKNAHSESSTTPTTIVSETTVNNVSQMPTEQITL